MGKDVSSFIKSAGERPYLVTIVARTLITSARTCKKGNHAGLDARTIPEIPDVLVGSDEIKRVGINRLVTRAKLMRALRGRDPSSRQERDNGPTLFLAGWQ